MASRSPLAMDAIKVSSDLLRIAACRRPAASVVMVLSMPASPYVAVFINGSVRRCDAGSLLCVRTFSLTERMAGQYLGLGSPIAQRSGAVSAGDPPFALLQSESVCAAIAVRCRESSDRPGIKEDCADEAAAACQLPSADRQSLVACILCRLACLDDGALGLNASTCDV